MLPSVVSGLGLGLRFDHFDEILSSRPSVPWFEVIVEDFLSQGPHHAKLMRLREEYPIVFHSVGMNLGGVDPFEDDYLKSLKLLYERYAPCWISDHLCWSAHKGRYHHDLLPIPRTQEALEHVCARIQFLQNYFKQTLCIENITSYLDYQSTDFEEIDFINQIVQKTGCKLLLDITNVSINHMNRKENSSAYFERFPLQHVRQMHLSGGSEGDDITIDSHGSEVHERDIQIYQEILEKGHNIPAIIERDSNIPSFAELESERQNIERVIHGI